MIALKESSKGVDTNFSRKPYVLVESETNKDIFNINPQYFFDNTEGIFGVFHSIKEKKYFSKILLIENVSGNIYTCKFALGPPRLFILLLSQNT